MNEGEMQRLVKKAEQAGFHDGIQYEMNCDIIINVTNLLIKYLDETKIQIIEDLVEQSLGDIRRIYKETTLLEQRYGFSEIYTTIPSQTFEHLFKEFGKAHKGLCYELASRKRASGELQKLGINWPEKQ